MRTQKYKADAPRCEWNVCNNISQRIAHILCSFPIIIKMIKNNSASEEKKS